jgi:glycosyltransferase involved in cell wall biosynthesis
MREKRIAVIINGGVVGGHFNQGIPALVELLGHLSERYDLTVYQCAKPESAERPSRPFLVRTFGRKLIGPTLLLRLLGDHMHRPYALIHGLWASSGHLAVFAARLLRLPAVVSLLGGEVANVPEIAYGGLADDRQVRRLKRICERAAAVVTLSQFQDAKLQEVHRVATSVVPLGVDIRKFAFRERPIELPCQFIHVANLTAVKDQETLVRAFAILRSRIDCRLTIVGPDYLQGRLHRFVESMNLSDAVTFTGPVPHTALPEYYGKAHILLHTSLYESLGVVALEAMASGVVVCGTAVGILADLAGKACLAVAPRDSAGLANGVSSLLADPSELARLRRSAREWVTRHSIESTASDYSRIYEDKISAWIGR